jgi:hypothetical protein
MFRLMKSQAYPPIVVLLLASTMSYAQQLNPSAFSSCANWHNQLNGSLQFAVGELAVFKLTDNNGTSISPGVLSGSVITVSSIGENKNKTTEYSVYPNPFQESVSIKSTLTNTKCEIVLFNTIGQRVYSKIVSSMISSEMIDLSFLTSGSYILEIVDQTNNLHQHFRLIKTR